MTFIDFIVEKRLVPEKNAKYYQVWIDLFKGLKLEIPDYFSVSQGAEVWG